MTDTSTPVVGKPAIQSTTVWGALATILFSGLQIAGTAGLLPAGAVATAVTLVGPALVVGSGLLALWGRYRPSIQPIVGVIQNPAKRAALEQAAFRAAVDAAIAARAASNGAAQVQPAPPAS